MFLTDTDIMHDSMIICRETPKLYLLRTMLQYFKIVIISQNIIQDDIYSTCQKSAYVIQCIRSHIAILSGRNTFNSAWTKILSATICMNKKKKNHNGIAFLFCFLNHIAL